MKIKSMLAALLIAAVSLNAQKAPKSQKELEALQKMYGTTDPDATIAAANDLIVNFKDTQFKGDAYERMTQAAEMKKDWEKAIVYAEQTIKIMPESFFSTLIAGRAYAESTKEFDFDREDKLKKAAEFSNKGIAIVTAAKNPNPQGLPEAQWEAIKKDQIAYGHETLGIADVVRKKYDSAIAHLKEATTVSDNPTIAARLGQTYLLANKKEDAIAVFKKLEQSTEPGIADYAKSQLAKIK